MQANPITVGAAVAIIGGVVVPPASAAVAGSEIAIPAVALAGAEAQDIVIDIVRHGQRMPHDADPGFGSRTPNGVVMNQNFTEAVNAMYSAAMANPVVSDTGDITAVAFNPGGLAGAQAADDTGSALTDLLALI